jgi:hypothetical protein
MSALVVRHDQRSVVVLEVRTERTDLNVCTHLLLFVLKASATGMLRNLLAHLR